MINNYPLILRISILLQMNYHYQHQHYLSLLMIHIIITTSIYLAKIIRETNLLLIKVDLHQKEQQIASLREN